MDLRWSLRFPYFCHEELLNAFTAPIMYRELCSIFCSRFYRRHSEERYGRFVSMKLSSGLRKCDVRRNLNSVLISARAASFKCSSRRWIVRSYSLYAAAEQRNLSLRSESKYRAHLARLYENGWYLVNTFYLGENLEQWIQSMVRGEHVLDTSLYDFDCTKR